MARTMVATASAQMAVAAIALISGAGSGASGPLEILLLTGVFAGMWLISAGLFRIAAE